MDIVRATLQCLISCFTCKASAIINRGPVPIEQPQLTVNSVSNCPAIVLSPKDVQNALIQIVKDNTTNIINVDALTSRDLQHQEMKKRIRFYSQKLAQKSNSVPDSLNKPSGGLLKDIPNPEMLLSSTPISTADLNMMRNLVLDASSAFNKIEINCREPVVVPFNFRIS